MPLSLYWRALEEAGATSHISSPNTQEAELGEFWVQGQAWLTSETLLRTNTGLGGVVQWQSVHLECSRPWVRSPALKNKCGYRVEGSWLLHTFWTWVSLFLSVCISFFSRCCDNKAWLQQLKEKRVYSGSQFASPSYHTWHRDDSRNVRQPTTLQLQPGSSERCSPVLRLIFFFVFSLGPQPTVPPTFRADVPTSESANLENL